MLVEMDTHDKRSFCRARQAQHSHSR